MRGLLAVLLIVLAGACRQPTEAAPVADEKASARKYNVVVLVDSAKLTAFSLNRADVVAALARVGRIVTIADDKVNGAQVVRVHVFVKEPFELEKLTALNVGEKQGAPIRLADVAALERRGP
jgi:multidrug efflux pump subunit AcrB